MSNKTSAPPDFSMRGNTAQANRMEKAKPVNSWSTIKRLWHYLSYYKRGIVAVISFTIIATLLNLVTPYLLGLSIDMFIMKGDWHGLMKLAALLLLLYGGASWFTWLQQKVMVKVAQLAVQRMRTTLFAAMQRLPVSFFDRRTHGELMSRTTNDIENVSASLNQSTTGIISSIISLVGSVAFMLYMNVWLTLLCMVTIPLVMLFTKYVASFTRKHFSEQQKQLGELNGFIEETIAGQKAIQLAQREQYAARQFADKNKRLTSASIKAQIYAGLVGPVMNVLNHTSFTIIAAVGGWMAFQEWTSVGVIVAFINYSKQFQRPINELANQFNMIQSGIAGAERVFEVIDTEDEYGTEAEANTQRITGDVTFEHVSFGYNEHTTILKDINLHAKAGQTIALVGPTGAGKTTIINMLTRFYDIQSGCILIDGMPLQQFNKDQLRSQLGIVLQDAHLFSSTIYENIRYGRLNATKQEIIEAAQAANAHRFIVELPQQYETVLAAEGSNLSQGQRQLITIARALLADPAILILDEATSNIDTRTEMHIQQAMAKLLQGRTSFVIAHRLSTIREADQILFIDQGQIIERGTHEQLLAAKGRYYELYSSQFKRASAQ
ncbi:multidrug ABC transporter ATP-binding protein [Paenibacillus montaniterrae]|uniref:Multidrug ABC transporter ATP-binding protein n=1 Tax=Paenibacillus montaniterrae TaxID=429341 RepID=A0A920CSW9_9BACL|nr:ABC transporter ATP-binding protein [Paenibacillus montaniterrae]GIP15232.1 multidrug ABC transporter ATP-binding protein [Paenibacillus montaniterrae]